MNYKKIIKGIAKFTRKYPFKGCQRILNFLFPPSNKKKIVTIFKNYDGDLKINIDTSSYIEWVVFFKGYYEPGVTKIINKYLTSGDIGIDVGANVGVHTLVMSRNVKNEGNIYAFEPNLNISKKLLLNLNLNKFNNTKIINEALSDKMGNLDFFINDEKDINKGQSSFYKENLKNNSNKIKVSVNTLDNFVEKNNIKKIKFIKIDTEGNDFNVIKGAKKIINRHKPKIIFEYDKKTWNLSGNNITEAFNFFIENKYKFYSLNNRNGKLKEVGLEEIKNIKTGSILVK